MACWSRRTVLILLGSLLLLSVIVRYPFVEHERYQTDSYFIHHLADSVAMDGSASWIYHPLSYVGYYPLSYPSGVPFLLAEFSLLSGLNIDVSILVMDVMIAAIFCLAVFLMARHFIPRIEYALLATFFAILGSRFIDTSYWDASARAPVVAVLTLVALTFFSARAYGRRRMVAIGVILCLGCFTMHHMAILLILFGTAYVVAVLETDIVFRRVQAYGRRIAVAVAILSTVMIIAVPFLLFDYFWESAVRGFQGSALFSFESTILTVVLTAATSYINQIGFILLFAVAYVPILMRKLTPTFKDILPVSVVVVFLPMFGDTLYVSMVLSPFIAVLGTLWFVHALKGPRSRRRVTVVLLVLMILSLALPFWSTDRWNSETMISGDTVLVGNQVFNDACYAMENTDSQNAICNVIPLRIRMETFGRIGFLGSGILLALNGDVTEAEVHEGVQQSSVVFPKNIYNWFEYDQEPPVNSYVRDLMIQGTSYMSKPYAFSGGIEYFSQHSRMIVVIDNRWSSEYLTTNIAYDAKFAEELITSRSLVDEFNSDSSSGFSSYLHYRSSLVSVFVIQLPNIAA